jgi:peptide/nickel transport system substrate-binding protein
LYRFKINKIIFIVLITFILYGQSDYYGIRYAEMSKTTSALDPIHGRKKIRDLRFGELTNAYLWRWGAKLEREADLIEEIPTRENIRDKSIKCRLKKNLLWPDGNPITVDDIMFTINTYQNSKLKRVKYIGNLFKCTKDPDYEFGFILSPNSKSSEKNFFNKVLNYIPNFQILPSHKFSMPIIESGDEYSRLPLGAGPYVFHENSIEKDGERVIIDLDKNKNYHFEEKESSIEKVILVTEPNYVNQLNGMTKQNELTYQGNRHIGLDLLVEEPSTVTVISQLRASDHIDYEEYAENSWYGIGFNTRKKLLKNRRFRVLIDEMINDKAIIQFNYPFNSARDITGPFNPTFGIYKEELKDRYNSNKAEIKNILKNEFNMELSNGVLQYLDPKTGIRQDLELKLIYREDQLSSGSRESNSIKQIVNTLFTEFGLKINLDMVVTVKWNNRIKDYDNWDLIFTKHTFGWDNNITSIFNPKSNQSYTGYDNVVLQDYIKNYKSANNSEMKISSGELIHEHCYENQPYIFLWTVKQMTYHRDLLRNISITPMTFFTTISDWEVTPRPVK